MTSNATAYKMHTCSTTHTNVIKTMHSIQLQCSHCCHPNSTNADMCQFQPRSCSHTGLRSRYEHLKVSLLYAVHAHGTDSLNRCCYDKYSMCTVDIPTVVTVYGYHSNFCDVEIYSRQLVFLPVSHLKIFSDVVGICNT